MKNLYSFIFIVILFVQNSFAQKFTHKSTIETVKEKGFYQIHLPNAMRKYAESNLRDLRITDKDNKQVPYIGNIYNFQEEIKGFKELKFSGSSYSDIIIEKGDSLYWNSFIIKASNSAATKQYILSGSNDNTNWFAITDTSSFTLLNNVYSSETYQLIEFPKVDYQYIKLSIDNSESEPINIISTGNITNTLLDKYFDKVIPNKVDFINDTFNNVSSIHFQLDELQQIDNIRFYISGPSYFLREVNLHKKVTRVSKNKNTLFRETISLFELYSKAKLAYDVNLFEKDFYIEISNFDNQPLQIDSIVLLQNPYFLVAELAPNNVYQVQCGDKTLNIPNYDIGNFTSLNNSNLPIINIGIITDLRQPKRPEITVQYLIEQKWFMWVCIGIGAIVLAVFSVRLIKNIK